MLKVADILFFPFSRVLLVSKLLVEPLGGSLTWIYSITGIGRCQPLVPKPGRIDTVL
jgi:hypothetical protein